MTWKMLLTGIAVALTAAACGSATGTTVENRPGSPEEATATFDGSGEGPAVVSLPQGPSALRDVFDDAFVEPLIDPRDLLIGGPPPDGIPSIDAPIFLDVAEHLEILPPTEPVIALEINGDARAYPVRALVWHEIVNDTVGGVPVVITYCPLCNSAAAFDRRVAGAPTTFGTSGMLYHSALVMYDRATESLWTHFDGTSVIGLLTGVVLEEYPSPLLAWSDFRAAYPTGAVLDWTRTGVSRDYGRNPYAGYDDPDSSPDLFRGNIDGRAAAMRRVVGIAVGDEAIAYPLDLLMGRSGSVTPVTVGGQDLSIFWTPGQASALDDVTLAGGRDVGSVGVFKPVVEQMMLTFEYDGESFVDAETASSWSIAGDAVAGPLKGARLERVPHFDTFWFAWAAYEPTTALVEE
ncbi:MAG: DUF3179 domain-containing protein [Actinomycetota bacterium]